jgi:hypothetical protein
MKRRSGKANAKLSLPLVRETNGPFWQLRTQFAPEEHAAS